MNFMSDDDFNALVAEHDKHSSMFSREREQAAQQFCWDAGIKIIKSCGHLDLPEYHVQFEVKADRKIKLLLKAYPRLEWLGYLVGKVDHEACQVVVEDLVIPKQQVTAASVYNVEYAWNEGLPIIGVIHSHHTMGAFFSGTDDTYINQNHDVSIVVATAPGREIKAQVRVKAPCGSYYINEKVRFSVNMPVTFDEAEFETEFKSKIGQFTYNTTYIGSGGGRVVHGGTFRRAGRRYNSSGYPLSATGGRLDQTLDPEAYNRIVGGGGTRNTSNHLIPSANSLLGGYSTEADGWDTGEEQVEFDFKNPHDMDEDELREELLKFYSLEDANDFIETDEAADELEEIYKMMASGVFIEPLTEVDFDDEEGQQSSTVTQAELDELEQYRTFVH